MKTSRQHGASSRQDTLKLKSRFVIYCLLSTVYLTACSQDPALPAYQKAEELFSKMAYTKAIDGYNAIVNKYPESPYAPSSQYKIALINNLYLKNTRDAMDAYTGLILLYPKSKEVILARQDMADIYIKKGDYGKAIGEYQWLMKNTSGSARDNFHYQIAMTYLKLTDIKQTRIELQEILKNSPNSALAPQVYYQIANTYYLEGGYTTAIKAYEDVISLFPSSRYALEATLGKGVCLEEEGKLTEAMAIYKELKKDYPNPEVIKIRMEEIEARETKNIPAVFKEN